MGDVVWIASRPFVIPNEHGTKEVSWKLYREDRLCGNSSSYVLCASLYFEALLMTAEHARTDANVREDHEHGASNIILTIHREVLRTFTSKP